MSDESLAERLGTLARDLQRAERTEDVLARIVASAVAVVPGVQEASISVAVGRTRVDSRVPSGELPRLVDAAQTETGEGPCLDALHDARSVLVPDMATETRWPGFARRAAGLGVGSMLSFQLWVDGADLGALNLVSRRPHAFDEESEQVGEVFAAHAAVAFAASQQREHLVVGLASRDVIGQAKGMLMERYAIGAAQAFDLLVRLSQESNVKLREIADQLVHSEGRPPG